MHNITQAETNELIFYVKSELASPKYLLRFVNRSTGAENTCICTDQNVGDNLPVLVEVIESTTENRTAGQLTLSPPMNYDLYIYDQTSTTNLDYTLANELLKQDYCNVYEA